MIRIGYGYDCHAFCTGDHIVLSGIKIPHCFGIQAHSDGDVVLHALCDALLGALALGDIGQHFSDTDPQYKNRNSCFFVEKIYQLVKDRGYMLGNLDCTIHCELPKLAPHMNAMRQVLAELLVTDITNVSIKATRGEKMGFIGREEGLAASVVVLLVKSHFE